MGFSKKTSQPEIAISVTHPWHPGTQFVFHFPKQLPESAVEAEKTFLGLKDTERAGEHRKALVNVVAQMVTAEPEGFDDFPGAAEIAELKAVRARLEGDELKEGEREQLEERVRSLEGALDTARQTPLAKRMRDYFDDETQPELEAIIAGVWRAYKAAAIPAAYIKSPGDSGAPGAVSPSPAG